MCVHSPEVNTVIRIATLDNRGSNDALQKVSSHETSHYAKPLTTGY